VCLAFVSPGEWGSGEVAEVGGEVVAMDRGNFGWELFRVTGGDEGDSY
jgi:hypothetical protein